MTWTAGTLAALDESEEIDIVTPRTDGGAHRVTPIWAVRIGDEVFVRSWKGRTGAWFRHAEATGRLRFRLDGAEHAAKIEPMDPSDGRTPQIDQAYASKYDKYREDYLPPMVSPLAASATLALSPADEMPLLLDSAEHRQTASE